jgi:integral membrane protein
MSRPIDRRLLKALRTLGIVEGFSTILLFGVAMPLKYAAGMPTAVTVVGTVHGVLFLALVGMFGLAIDRVPIPVTLAAAGVVGAVVPFGPFVVDRRLARLETPEDDPTRSGFEREGPLSNR